MENASKALLMAAGILIALVIIGLLLIMVNQIGNYQNSKDASKKELQLAEFNLDFERYVDDNGIKGADIISLINKISDYNIKASKGGVINSVNYDIEMSITVRGFDRFNRKYHYDNNSLFENKLYRENELKSIVTSTYSDESRKRMISEFKSSIFRSYQGPTYENGQIKDFYFEFSE